jgi:hypothetical protein
VEEARWRIGGGESVDIIRIVDGRKREREEGNGIVAGGKGRRWGGRMRRKIGINAKEIPALL